MRSAARQRLYKCRECKAVYSDAEELWRHIRAEHGPIQYLYCRQCQYRATCRETVRKHYRSYHPGCEAEAESVKAEIERTGQTPRVALVRADGQPASPKQSAESEESGVPASTPLLPDVDPEPPRKMIKMATVKEHVTKDVIVEGRVVSREETTKVYFTKVTVDEDNHLVVS